MISRKLNDETEIRHVLVQRSYQNIIGKNAITKFDTIHTYDNYPNFSSQVMVPFQIVKMFAYVHSYIILNQPENKCIKIEANMLCATENIRT